MRRKEMNYKEYAFTASEITKLEHMLSLMPKHREVERIGLEYRLAKARQQLEGVPIPPPPRSVYVSFQGEPVSDEVGIDASFAGKTTTAFADSTAITIAGSTGQLKDTGAIPHRGLSQQLISGVAHRSFGFTIELPPPTAVEGRYGQTTNPAERAVEMIQNLLEASLRGADEDLAELTGQMHPRSVKKVAEFLDILKNNRAQVTIGFNGREVALRDPNEVERAATRLAARNIKEETVTVDGNLIGVVPARRVFELETPDGDENIQGKIGQEIHDPYRIAAIYTNRRIRVRIRQLQVGDGQPQYTLLEIGEPAVRL